MNKKKSRILIIICIIATVLLFMLPAISSEDESHDYGIPFVEKIITIQTDGSVNIQEDFNYTFRDTSHGLTRNIPLSANQEINNISVETPGLYNTVEVTNSSNYTNINVYVYTDAAKTQNVTNRSVNVIYHYNINKGVKIYNDVAEFQYMAWDNQSGKEVTRMTTYVKLPGNKTGVEMWNNPPYLVSSTSWITYNTLETRYKTIDSDTGMEQILLIPREQFNTTEDADVINQDAKEVIEQQQANYQTGIDFNYGVTYAVTVLSVILLLTPVGIYYKYGKEPRISYEKDYLTSIPSDDSPVFINAVIPGNVNKINVNAFYSTVLDLIDRGYMKIVEKVGKDVVIQITNIDDNNLQQYEVDLLEYLNQFTDEENRTTFKKIEDGADLSKSHEFFEKWQKEAEESIDENKINSFFQDRGSKLFKTYTKITLIYAVIALICIIILNPPVPTVDWAFRSTIILIPEAIITAVLPNTVGGQWTTEGKTFHDKWKHFEKYINDYTLIKEHPPESIESWGRYIVYAATLGDSQAVNKNMRTYFKQTGMSEEIINQSDTVALVYYGIYSTMYLTFYELIRPRVNKDEYYEDK